MRAIELGCTYTDKITGFSGVATGFVQYISGCNQAYLTPKCKPDGTPVDGGWYDQQRLDKVGTERIELANSTNPGYGPAAPAPR